MKKTTACLLIPLSVYVAFVFTITLVNRARRRKYRYNLELFWSVKAALNGKEELAGEIFWNIVLFVFLGLLFAALIRSLGHRGIWLSALAGGLLSAGVEVTQLLTRRGLFEFDDIVFNSTGAVIGVLLYLLIMKAAGKKPDKPE